MKQFSQLILFIFISLLFHACQFNQTDQKIISVTIEPQRYFAEKIAGDKFTIHSVVPAGQSPETYDPAPREMVNIGKSTAYFRIGYIGFEEVWMPAIVENNPQLKVFDMSEGIELIRNLNPHTHHHDHEGDLHHHHHHSGVDPHSWSSITGAKMIAWNMLNAFIALDPEHTKYYWNNYGRLMYEIEETEKTIGTMFKGLQERTFIIYHPALTYLAHEYRLNQLCIERDEKEPSPAQLKELIEEAREYKARVVFVQQEFDRKNAELIARETSCRLVSINPLDYNWSQEMIRIATALTE